MKLGVWPFWGGLIDYKASRCCVPSADLEAAGAWSLISNLKDPGTVAIGRVSSGHTTQGEGRQYYEEIHWCFQEVGSFGQRCDTRFQHKRLT